MTSETRALTDREMRRSLHVAALLGTTLPPFAGATVMGLIGIYPFPSIYLIFTNGWVVAYVGATIALTQWWAARTWSTLETRGHSKADLERLRRFLDPLPWQALAAVTGYSIGGIGLADFALVRLGLAVYDVRDFFLHLGGLIPVVGVSLLPTYFYAFDRLGRYLGPRGIVLAVSPLRTRLAILGLLTPVLIDTMLIIYIINETGTFGWEALFAWTGLMAMAGMNTWMTWSSVHQGLLPLQRFASTGVSDLDHSSEGDTLVPLSLDELGILTTRVGEMLSKGRASETSLDAFFSQSMDGCFFMLMEPPTEWHDGVDKDQILEYAFANQRITRVNQAMLDQYGAKSESFLGLTPNDLMAHDIDYGKGLWRTLFDQGRLSVETAERRLDGTPIWIQGEYVVLRDEQDRIVGHFGIQRDITAQREAIENVRLSAARLARAQQAAKVGSWELDLVSDGLIWSDEIYRLFELDPTIFAPSYDAFLGAVHPDDRGLVDKAYQDSLSNREPYVITHRLLMPDGRLKWVEERCATDFAEDGTPLVSRGTVQDVTTHVQADQTLQAALRQKDVLLREIHHRVKNNLQIVSSLIHFQAKGVTDPQAVRVFDVARERLRSMVLVHEQLYQTGDLSQVEMDTYLKSLVNQLSTSSLAGHHSIVFRTAADPVRLPIEVALPVGMIVTELVTNVLKYAFPDGKHGSATLVLSEQGGRVSVTVSDDGAGFPPGFDAASPSGFGWQLINALAMQIDGRVQIGDGPGAWTTISFAAPSRS